MATQRNTLNQSVAKQENTQWKSNSLSFGKSFCIEAALLGADGEGASLEEQVSNAKMSSAAPQSQSCKYISIC